MKKNLPQSTFPLPHWPEMLFACAMALSPYLLAWLVLAMTQA